MSQSNLFQQQKELIDTFHRINKDRQQIESTAKTHYRQEQDVLQQKYDAALKSLDEELVSRTTETTSWKETQKQIASSVQERKQGVADRLRTESREAEHDVKAALNDAGIESTQATTSQRNPASDVVPTIGLINSNREAIETALHLQHNIRLILIAQLRIQMRRFVISSLCLVAVAIVAIITITAVIAN